jgi:hypothetical protein
MTSKFALVVAVALFSGAAFGAVADGSPGVTHAYAKAPSPWDQAFEAFAGSRRFFPRPLSLAADFVPPARSA